MILSLTGKVQGNGGAFGINQVVCAQTVSVPSVFPANRMFLLCSTSKFTCYQIYFPQLYRKIPFHPVLLAVVQKITLKERVIFIYQSDIIKITI